MSVLVTGATGFIGGALVRALRAEGEGVRVLLRPGSDARPLEAVGAVVVRGDVADPAAMHAAADGCEVVYSLAVSPRVGRQATMQVVNVEGARNAATAASAVGARLVHGSSCSVYGVLRTLPAAETHPTNPTRPYARSKLAGERAVAEVTARTGASACIVRIASVHGPGNLRGLASYRSALAPVTPVIAGARHLVDIVHVDDVVAGLRACGARDGGSVTYNLGGGSPMPLIGVLEMIAAAAGRRLRPLTLPRSPFIALEAAGTSLLRHGIDSRIQNRYMHVPRSQAFAISRAADELGYRPTVEVREGVAGALAWYRDAGLIDRNGQGGRA